MLAVSPKIHSGSSNSRHDSTHNHGVHRRCSSAYSASDFKQDYACEIEPFDFKGTIERAEQQDRGDRAHRKADADPGQLLDFS